MLKQLELFPASVTVKEVCDMLSELYVLPPEKRSLEVANRIMELQQTLKRLLNEKSVQQR